MEKSMFKRRGVDHVIERLLAGRFCSLQDDMVVANAPGATVRADINNNLQALATLNSGASAPTTTYARMFWADTSTGVLKQRNAANSAWIIRGPLGESMVLARAANTILAVGDFAATVVATSTFTQTFNAASALGSGWWCAYRNNGSGVITLDPNSGETIDGAATLLLGPGNSCVLVCDGANFFTVGRSADEVQQTLADGVTINWDAALGKIGKVTLGGNRTLAAPTNLKKGVYVLHVYQDATGSRTLTWNALFKWPGAVAPVLTTTANYHDVFTFIYDGTSLFGSSVLGYTS